MHIPQIDRTTVVCEGAERSLRVGTPAEGGVVRGAEVEVAAPLRAQLGEQAGRYV